MRTQGADARDLTDAIAAGLLDVVYQPQIDLASGRVVAIECLSRWTHGQLGPIPPTEFVALAEATGSIHDLGRFALVQACRFGGAWRRRGIRLEVAVNVSPLQLATDTFFDVLERELFDSGMAAEDLTLEVTEGERIDDHAVLAARLDIIREWGVTVSIDDYGMGHSSLKRAAALHAGELKLDRGIVASEDRMRIGRAAGVAHAAGMRVVAEGIESARQLRMAADLGCDRAQGYFISRPLPPPELERWMLGAGSRANR